MTTNQDDQVVSRRKFIKAAALTAVAASATGAGAAIYNQNQNAATVITSVPNNSAPIVSTAVPSLTSPDSDLFTRLAAAQAENVRLQAALDAAQRQLTSLQTNNQTAVSDSEALTVELSQANEHIGVLAGLIALYEQFAAVDVETAVEEGFSNFTNNIETFLADVPTLSESIQMGRQALQNFESQVSILDNGRLWLIDHLAKIEGYFAAVEQLLSEAVEHVGPFLQMLNDWFDGVKKWLPFGIGQTAAAIMQSITTLIMETPNTLSGLDTNVMQPLNVWLNRDQNNETALHQTLINPLRDDLMPKADNAVSKAQQMDTTYKTMLKEPVETAVSSQRAIRGLINAYRERHGIQ
ncbi:twin-arginine translocation signal domain-containing protein [Candidatus Leptofilum sp.]|uniref:twin-arginine translocation signal domain-containing protein n=1 Tax=Candidatus Leptofilum sp. TaxID=3241576 RepID=UPI003B5A2216